MIDLKTGNVWALVVAVIVGTALIMYQQSYYEAERARDYARRVAEPAETWFIVRNVAVPDFVQGDDPIITYDREIKGDFKGSWTAEFHAVEASNDYPICSGGGANSYKTTEMLPVTGVELSWFVGKDCKLPPGRYVLETEWHIEVPGYPTKVTRYISNPFAVIPRGGQIYITPEQVQKLQVQ